MRMSDWSSDVCSSDLGPDDVIEVSVLGRPEMTHQTRIKPDGTIVLPLAGTVKASNHTILTLADEIGKKMEKGRFLRNPIINVEVIPMVSQTADGRTSCREGVCKYGEISGVDRA